MTGHRIIKNLTKRGNAVLGVGVYSAALSAKNGIDAIKIGTSMDDPWLDFKALVVEALPNNTHLPHIKSFYYDNSSEFFVCVMERLETIAVDSPAAKLVDVCKEYVEGYHSDEEFITIAKEHIKVVPKPTELLSALQTIKQYTTHIKWGQPVGVDTSTYRSEDFEQNYDGRMLDMHRGNFMLREGILVITDPWCNVSMDEVADLSIWAEEQISESMQHIY